jgi:D-beta-D-heptose 7-phosphate kinase/D-beta-D-heptose 1-phosphate adenosyltransferase
VVVDPKGPDYSHYRGADLVTPNRRELSEATGMATDSDEEVVAAARAMIRDCGIGAVLVTRSEHGMTLVVGDAEDGVTHVPARAQEVADVSGAGDTVVAMLATALASGIELVDAVRLANVAAGIVVSKLGTAVATSSEVSQALRATDMNLIEAKTLPLDALLNQIAAWRGDGKRVGFTNGCFDILHPGHISLLRQAREACDKLVVGLNSDASVRRLKGEERPVQSEAARGTVIGSLESVDAVVIFGEDTPFELISQIRPDVLVKGADYTVETVVGADVVQSYGGKVVLARLAEGHSTTRTIERIAAGK